MGRYFLPIAIGILVLLFFPIRFEADVYADLERKKLAFGVYLYGRWKVIGGYMTAYPGGFALHIKKDKAILLPYADMETERKRFSFVNTFRLKRFAIATQTGAEYLLPVGIVHAFVKTLFYAKGGEKQRCLLKVEHGDTLNVAGRLVAWFNGFILLKAFMKFLKEKVESIWRKKTEKSTV